MSRRPPRPPHVHYKKDSPGARVLCGAGRRVTTQPTIDEGITCPRCRSILVRFYAEAQAQLARKENDE